MRVIFELSQEEESILKRARSIIEKMNAEIIDSGYNSIPTNNGGYLTLGECTEKIYDSLDELFTFFEE